MKPKKHVKFLSYGEESHVVAQMLSIIKDHLNKFFEHIIVILFLPVSFNMCFGCSKEPSHRDGSYEYPQHMFWLRNKNK